MAASYPTSTKSFTTKLAAQTVASAHVNDLQDEVVAIEAALRGTLAHALTPDGDATRALGTTAARWLHPAGTVTAPGVAVSETDCGLYSSGANAIEIATNGVKALGIDSTQFVDSPTQPRCVAYHSATQSLTNNTITALSLDSEVTDVGAMHDLVTNNSRITIPTGGDGFYLIYGAVTYAGNATGERRARLHKNGALMTAGETVAIPSSTVADVTVPVTMMATLAAGDYIELAGFQTSGGALTAGNVSSQAANRLMLVKLW